tara:strand:+ start:218 stop:988 length:771 start_codon:yes stop_codon:yes gene_type:complete
MRRFKTFSRLIETAEANGMNKIFIQRAMQVTSFNLLATDFQSLDYKKEIQYLFSTHFFPRIDIKFQDTVDAAKLNTEITKLKRANKSNFEHLHKYNLKGIGPGEVVLYFLLNKGHLGGGSSAGVDLVVGQQKYEIKAVDLSGDGKQVFNFKTGGTFNTSDLIARALKMKSDVNGSGEGVSKGVINKIKEQMPTEWKKLEDDYRKRVYDNYFKNHVMIFMNNKTAKIGEIIAVKTVAKKDIEFERVTSGVIKPRVNI